MNDVAEFTPSLGSTVATFAANGTFSAPVDLNGQRLVAAAAPDWPGASGTFVLHGQLTASGTGAPLHSGVTGPIRGTLGPGLWCELGDVRGVPLVRLVIGTAGTCPGPGGGSVALFTRGV